MSYELLRRIHAAVALLILATTLVYGISAFQMTHGLHYGRDRSERVVQVPTDLDAAGVVAWLRSEQGLRGKAHAPELRDGVLQLRFERPGTVVRVAVSPDGAARLVTERASAIGLMNRLHHAAGFGHGDPATDAWGVLVLLASLGLWVAAASGVWMWWQLRAERRLGLVLACGSAAVTLLLLVAVRMA